MEEPGPDGPGGLHLVEPELPADPDREPAHGERVLAEAARMQAREELAAAAVRGAGLVRESRGMGAESAERTPAYG